MGLTVRVHLRLIIGAALAFGCAALSFLSLPAQACTIPPESSYASLEKMLSASDAVYVGHFVGIHFRKGERLYTLKVSETLKGKEMPFVSVSVGWNGSDEKQWRESFERQEDYEVGHNNPLFWLQQNTFGHITPSCETNFFPHRGSFVVFLPADSVRAMEPILSTNDAWYKTVKSASAGKPPYLPLSIPSFLQRLESVYLARCIPDRPRLQNWEFEHIRGKTFDKQHLKDNLPGNLRYPPVGCFAHVQPSLELLISPTSDSLSGSTFALAIIDGKVSFEKHYGDIELTEKTVDVRQLKQQLRD